MIHSKGSRKSARLRHATAATYFCLPKKHTAAGDTTQGGGAGRKQAGACYLGGASYALPMLFHSWLLFGVWSAATRYFTRATSMSEWS